MKALKIIIIIALAYAGIVILFESLLGHYQPEGDNTLVITTTDSLDSGGQIYVAANHWPRAWYHQALENPNVFVTLDERPAPYVAVRVTDAEHSQVDSEHSLGPVIRFLTGFPPRYIVRLDPA